MLYLNMYRLDKTSFKAHTAKHAAASHAAYYKTLSWQEWLKIAHYLNSIAYNFPPDNLPRMDKTKFSVRSSEDE